MDPIITLPVDFTSTITGYMGQIFVDFAPLIALIVGVLLGVIVVEIIVGIIRHK